MATVECKRNELSGFMKKHRSNGGIECLPGAQHVGHWVQWQPQEQTDLEVAAAQTLDCH